MGFLSLHIRLFVRVYRANVDRRLSTLARIPNIVGLSMLTTEMTEVRATCLSLRGALAIVFAAFDSLSPIFGIC